MKTDINGLAHRWQAILAHQKEHNLLRQLITDLDERYHLLEKAEREPGVTAVIEQLIGRIIHTFGSLTGPAGQRILDIACGSNSSHAPAMLNINTPLQTSTFANTTGQGYTTLFEPWFCRLLLALGANPVGIDFGDLSGESFEHYHVDLTQIGSLNFLPSHSFDAVQDSRLFGSPEFTALLSDPAERLKVAQEIVAQEHRLLVKGGLIIHSDAARLVQNV